VKIDDLLYFAPGIRFDEVNFDGHELPDQFEQRIRGFYLGPASRAVEAGDAFAAGVLLVVCIDALARFQIGGAVGERFKTFARKELASFADEGRARDLYDMFRNGLVHEARIKSGAQFTLDFDPAFTYHRSEDITIINPARLAEEVQLALDVYVERLKTIPETLEQLAAILKADHAADV
jgi:hypothetical protein